MEGGQPSSRTRPASVKSEAHRKVASTSASGGATASFGSSCRASGGGEPSRLQVADSSVGGTNSTAACATLVDVAISLGVRCWKDRIALVALDHLSAADPGVVLHRRSKLAGTSDSDRVVWVHKIVTEAIEEAEASIMAVRISDDAHADQRRAEHDGVALHAGAARDLEVMTLRRQSMLKPLGVPSGAGAWAKFQKTDPFLTQFVADEKEAAMAARAALNRGSPR